MAGILHQFIALRRELWDLDEDDYLAMARQGVTAGALSTEKRGGIPSIPSLEEIQAHLRG